MSLDIQQVRERELEEARAKVARLHSTLQKACEAESLLFKYRDSEWVRASQYRVEIEVLLRDASAHLGRIS